MVEKIQNKVNKSIKKLNQNVSSSDLTYFV